MKARLWTVLAICLLGLAACASGPVRRVSEPGARIQQLTVRADGGWSVELRLENFSSIPMRFDSVDLALTVAGEPAGRLATQPGLNIGPESADVVAITVMPAAAAKIAVADALASGRSAAYTLDGTLSATPDEGRLRVFEIDRTSALNPAPGLPGVMR